VVADHPEELCASVAVDDADHSGVSSMLGTSVLKEEKDNTRRSYITAVVRVRLYQRSFRERVLEAYQRQCAFCRFRHEEILDAAQIVPDSQPHGEPLVRNGLALCTFHHSAFDRNFLAVRLGYSIRVRPDLLREKDGPTLVHAIQVPRGQSIVLPRSTKLRPGKEFLANRYHQLEETS